MPTLSLTLTSTALAANWTGTLETFRQELLGSITATTNTANVILGQISGSVPGTNVGPWLDDSSGVGVWKYYSGGAYRILDIKLGGPTFYTTLVSAPTSNQTITIPNIPAGGVLATLDDVFVPRATQATVLGGDGVNRMDWADSNSFIAAIGGNITLGATHSVAGQEVFIAVRNVGALSYQVSWTSDIHFAVTPTTLAFGKINLYVLRNVAGTIYGVSYLDYPI